MKIILLVEGETEIYLPRVIKRWLDKRISPSIGVKARNFKGASKYLKDLAQQVTMQLEDKKVVAVIGILDFYGLPEEYKKGETVKEKISFAKKRILELVPSDYRDRFFQGFAVFETEAWLFSDPKIFGKMSNKISKYKSKNPENINFDTPPAKILMDLVNYKKGYQSKKYFDDLDVEKAYEKCPHLAEILNKAKELVELHSNDPQG